MTQVQRPKPLVLAILDGWGVAPAHPGNAISAAKLPNWERFLREYPAMTLAASGEAVGLSWGELGTSEIGHLNIGAGRIYYQSLARINQDILSEGFYRNPVLKKVMVDAKQRKVRMHFIGLVSSGGVHSSQEHLYALMTFAKREGLDDVAIHVILDGRDTMYNSGKSFVEALEREMDHRGIGRVASMSGRFFAMDRDNHWERIAKAYAAIVDGTGPVSGDADKAIEASYAKKVFDEEFEPVVIVDHAKKPVGNVRDGDCVIFFNFRPDRMRELVKAFVLPGFEKFPRNDFLKSCNVVTMTEYETALPVVIAYPQLEVKNCLAQVLSENGLSQLHIAETEKYAHVTYFLNGGREQPFPRETRLLVPSPRVASYARKPEMSAPEITSKILTAIADEVYDVIIVNYANADMVGHTGDLKGTIAAVEEIDRDLGKLWDAIESHGGVLLITADHGNAEEVVKVHTGQIDKEHSTTPVPFIVLLGTLKGHPAAELQEMGSSDLSVLPTQGVLADIAPTVLKLLNLPQPPEMIGRPLV